MTLKQEIPQKDPFNWQYLLIIPSQRANGDLRLLEKMCEALKRTHRLRAKMTLGRAMSLA